MKKYFLLVVSSFLLLGGPAWAVYKAKKVEESAKPEFQSAEEERLYHLRQGDILTDGGYLKKGVWGTMEGVVDAPPDVVWRLFIYANDWRKYGLPDLKDCRAVDEEILGQVKETRDQEAFYKVLGDRVIDPVAPRKNGGKWENFTFQFYNVPWPISDKWFIIKNFADETRSSEGVYETKWEKRAGNVRDLHGQLNLEPFDGDKTKTLLHYRVETDPGAVPKFLLKWGVKRSLPAAMKVIRREAVRLKSSSSSSASAKPS